MTGVPHPLQLFQRIVTAHLYRAFGSDGPFDISVLDFIARRPVKPRSPAGLHRAAAEGAGLELQSVVAFTQHFWLDAVFDICRVWIRFHAYSFL